MDFHELALKLQSQKPHPMWDKPILAFDPGHTTGWAFFDRGLMVVSGEIDTTSISACMDNTQPLLHSFHPHVVIMEDYRIYKWRQKHHVGSELLTTQIIGCLETLAIQDFVNFVIKQPAHIAKGFCTDKKLKEWNYYIPGQRHARDAIRHGCYYILFGPLQKKDRS